MTSACWLSSRSRGSSASASRCRGRFLFFNATGGIVASGSWAQEAFRRLSTPANLASGAIGLCVAVWLIVAARRNAGRLEAQAERALPGALEA